MSDLLFKITESKTQGAIRWQKRALQAEARVAVLEAKMKTMCVVKRSGTLSDIPPWTDEEMTVFGMRESDAEDH